MADRPKVVQFARPEPPPFEPDPQMVEAIEGLLERVKAGEVESVVWIEESPDGEPDCGECGTLEAALVAGRLLRLANLYAMEDGEEEE
jgi:hypothetical protein